MAVGVPCPRRYPFASLSSNIFRDMGALEVLRIRYTTGFGNAPGLGNFQATTFQGLAAVREIYLDDNGLTDIPAGVFAHLVNLETLSLIGNELATFPATTFQGLTALRKLYLRNNELTDIPAGAFSDLANLEILHIYCDPSITYCRDGNEGLTCLPMAAGQ